MSAIYIVCFLALTVGIVLVLGLTPEQLTCDLAGLFQRRKSLREQSLNARGKKKSRRIAVAMQNIRTALEETGKGKQFSVALAASGLLFVVGCAIAIAIGNPFLIPVLAVAFAMIPFAYVDVAVAVLVVSFLLVLLVSVFGLVSKKQDLRYMASELIDAATVSGSVGQEVQKRYAQLCEETGLHPSVNWTAAYYDAATGKVQLGNVISVSLETETSLLGFGGVLFPVKLTATASGLSEIYWK